MEKFIHRYPPESMPLPPVPEHMEMFNAGPVTIGVEFRMLNLDVVKSHEDRKGKATNPELDDHGVSLHVYMTDTDGDLERLRFDCFEGDPHYHYVNWPNRWNDQVWIDPTMTGDVVAWAIECIRRRIGSMMEKAGIANASQRIDHKKLDEILPQVTEAAYRARFHADKGLIQKGAMADGVRRSA